MFFEFGGLWNQGWIALVYICNSSHEVGYSVKHEIGLACYDIDWICNGEGVGVPPK